MGYNLQLEIIVKLNKVVIFFKKLKCYCDNIVINYILEGCSLLFKAGIQQISILNRAVKLNKIQHFWKYIQKHSSL